jgi:putative two-component system hydrogenase maturation factor HypX/HoxX
MRVMLLSSAFNGLTQRVWLELREADPLGQPVERRAQQHHPHRAPPAPVCPFMRERIPEQVWRRWPTVVIHPGPVGDRGPSSLDWAITEGARSWGVTALQAVEELDAGPVWASRQFRLPPDPITKSALYAGPVTDAAVELVHEVVARAADPAFVPCTAPVAVGRARPAMRQSDREFCWSDSTEHIVRRVRAADGSPGVRTTLRGCAVSVFDAHRGPDLPDGEPGAVVGRRHGAVLVRTGDASVWIGQLRAVDAVKLPATLALPGGADGVPALQRTTLGSAGGTGDGTGFREIEYRRHGRVGVLSFDVSNGAMSTQECRRLAAAVRRAAARDTRVLVLRGGRTFSNGIHLNVIEAADDPAAAAWLNINAINDVCREILRVTDQLVVSALTGGAGAGGVMLALGADRVLLRDRAVLNPHYATMGLYGSEYWTYVLPRRVGRERAEQLTGECLPLGAAEAVRIGLADSVLSGPGQDVDDAVLDDAGRLAGRDDYGRRLARKRARRADDERRRPLESYRIRELAEMSRDIHDDRHGFAAARRAFVTKQPRSADVRSTRGPRSACG